MKKKMRILWLCSAYTPHTLCVLDAYIFITTGIYCLACETFKSLLMWLSSMLTHMLQWYYYCSKHSVTCIFRSHGCYSTDLFYSYHVLTATTINKCCICKIFLLINFSTGWKYKEINCFLLNEEGNESSTILQCLYTTLLWS